MNNLIDEYGWVTVWLWIGSYVSIFLYVCTQCQCVYVTWLDLFMMNYLHRRIDPKAYIVLRTQRKYSWKFLSNIIKRLYCISFGKKLIFTLILFKILKFVLLWYCFKFWYWYSLLICSVLLRVRIKTQVKNIKTQVQNIQHDESVPEKSLLFHCNVSNLSHASCGR